MTSPTQAVPIDLETPATATGEDWEPPILFDSLEVLPPSRIEPPPLPVVEARRTIGSALRTRRWPA